MTITQSEIHALTKAAVGKHRLKLKAYIKKNPNVFFAGMCWCGEATAEKTDLCRILEAVMTNKIESITVQEMDSLRKIAFSKHKSKMKSVQKKTPGMVVTCDICSCGNGTGMYSTVLCNLINSLMSKVNQTSTQSKN